MELGLQQSSRSESLATYNAQRIVAENKTSARQLQASGVFQDQQLGKRSLLELLAAAREVRDWALYAAILKNIRRRLNVSYGLNCALKDSAKVFSEHISKITRCRSDSDVTRVVEEVYREIQKFNPRTFRPTPGVRIRWTKMTCAEIFMTRWARASSIG